MAEKYSIEERDRLLRERKLDLLVDLDQTLLHTTNSSNYFPYSPVYDTKKKTHSFFFYLLFIY
jgi:TFIIF-interacting CTD phosphatase-like protein